MAVTIFDIARETGVSISTISRVINNSGPVKDRTREKVLEAIQKFNFQPNSIARSLVMKSTKTVGAIVADINNPFYSEIVRAIEDTADECGYTVILCNSDEDMEKEKKYIQVLMEKQVDGIIFAGGRGNGSKYNNHIKKLSEKIPIVLADEYLRGDNIYCVVCDKKEGAYEIIKHLISLGHRRIGFISGYPDYKPSIEKLAGYRKAIEEAGIEFDENLILYANYHIVGGYRNALRFLKLKDKPTAIFTANDLMAIGAMKALKRHGYRIPDDIAVVGFDDIKANNFVEPPLTSVSQNIYELGRQSVLLLTSIFDGKENIKKKIVIKPVLKIRESCGGKDKTR